MASSVDNQVRALVEHLRDLSTHQLAVFFASCAERLLPLYEAFVELEGWGDALKVRRALDASWTAVEGGVTNDPGLAVEAAEVEAVTPHADDFESVETILAQDACAAVGAALRSALGEAVDPWEVCCVFEALRVGITYAATGYLDLGGGETADKFEEQLGRHPRIVSAFATLDELIARLRHTVPKNAELVREVRTQARVEAWRREEVLSA